MKVSRFSSILFIGIFLSYLSPGVASAGTWEKTFGGTAEDAGHSVKQTADGGYIVVGETWSFGAGESDLYLIKTDSKGNQQWIKTRGTSKEDYGESILQTNDGGYIIAGYYWAFDPTDLYIWLMKTDSNGNELWSKTFERGWEETVSSLQQTSDGGYILSGYVDSFTTGFEEIWVIKTDSSGSEQWSKIYSGTNNTYFQGGFAQQTADDGYIIAGNTDGHDVWLTKINASGNEQWNKTLGRTNHNVEFVQQTSDGGYVIAGMIYFVEQDDIFIIKTDANGNELWRKTFGGTVKHRVESVQQTSDGGYIITGRTEDWPNTDVFLIKTDSSGNQKWSKTFGGSNEDEGKSVQQTSDGGYIVTGGTSSSGAGNSDVYLIYYGPETQKSIPGIPLLLLDD
jgi:hypothetical protein